jgi:hypothetical protein
LDASPIGTDIVPEIINISEDEENPELIPVWDIVYTTPLDAGGRTW